MLNKINSFYSTNFQANPNSPKLKFVQKDFFVRIRGYGKNSQWAKEIIATADEGVKFIRWNWGFENLLKIISLGVTKANMNVTSLTKRHHTGILRTEREGWRCCSDWPCGMLATPYEKGRYSLYRDKLDYVAKNKLDNPFDDIELSVPVIRTSSDKYIKHASGKYINNSFKHLTKLYSEFTKNYVKSEVKQNDLPNVNNIIATMRWILAHTTPWERGSDAISNVLIRAMYKSAGIKTFPLTKGVSLDLEAYCTNLQDYKQKFAHYFEKPPVIID